jgi:hypothetical protein
MKVRTLGVLILVCSCALLANSQARAVKLAKFAVDGKDVQAESKLFFQIDGKDIELVRKGNSFVVPADMERHETVDVRFVSGKYELNFEAVPVTQLENDWTFGVDTNPYEEENSSIETPPDPPGVELVAIHYLQFVAKDGSSTRQITKVYK